ncbi:type IV pilus biogenesis/stability protein PilW [Pseudoalteromonas sp. BDTF-M6]|uniref:type IV pilus biogenesis/stability protein PilW n=1 Tax=Pseudoalteromonas sp. BDTF-M6 TaxID=2796132 RepID=UPI001BB09BFE|nr:type IV pilus biogenesis/stability protein PilW [Pseudoalteromonas sp. BDTF-M6]MBS3797471.1 type IV pilus biogenesis/stability protein PilW [Pseudoalteromonas sp. BDTF-M6]
MRKLLVTSISLLALGGCVTESTYVGSDKPVVEKKINNVEAARTRISLALNYLSQGESTQAKYNLERAAKFAPELPEVHYSIAYYYQQVGEKQRAKDAYEKALSLEPNDPNTLNNYGVFLCDIGEYDLAVDKFMAAIEIPSYLRVAQSYENLALCALEFDKFDAAETFLEDSLQHSSLRPSSLINLAAVKYAKSDFYNAQQVLNRYERTGRVSSRSLLLGYLIQERMGHIEDARKLAETITVTYPSSLEARIIREQRYSASEFEQLREKYRRIKLNELQESMDGNVIVAKPKIKVVKKKASTKSDASAVVLATAAPATEFVETSVVKAAAKAADAVEVTTEGKPDSEPQAQPEQKQDSAEPSVELSAELSAEPSGADKPAEQPDASVEVATEPTADPVNEATTELVGEPAKESSVASPEEFSAQPVAQPLAQPALENQLVEQVDNVETKAEKIAEAANEAVTEQSVTPATSAADEPKDTPEEKAKAESTESANVSEGEGVSTVAEQKNELQSELAREFASMQLATDVATEDQPVVEEIAEDVAEDASEQLAANAEQLEETTNPNELDEDLSRTAEVVASNTKVIEQMAIAETAGKKEIPYHVMQKGENLFNVSTRYNIRLSTLRKWNNLASADHVQIGRKIYLQRPYNYHTVAEGDTLFEISKKYNVLMQKLMEWNQIEEDSKLVPGDKIYIADPKNYRL